MLSYLLENKTVEGVSTVERFRPKFADDAATFMMVDKCAKAVTDAILFDIDNVGQVKKDSTVVIRIFAKMFYNKIGFYGDNLKLAMMEKYVDEQGLTEEFRRVFEEKNGAPWEFVRKTQGFFEDDVVETLQEVLGISESAARHWFDSTVIDDELSIDKLVEQIADYVSKKPNNYRLLFMIDEVGQYVGTDHNMLLNLQTLIVQLGANCHGKVWVMCTGQDALDEIIKVRSDEFSRIMDRFKVRLSLTSSSADEVIQRRILAKKDDAQVLLEASYEKDAQAIKNLFKFKGQPGDIKGYRGPEDFARNFPFIPYQYIILQTVFNEVRKSGYSGKNMSSGERSMLSAFQEAAKAVMHCDNRTIVPFWRFYDTLHKFLDSNIRMIIERCIKAGQNDDGIRNYDVQVLKLLYLMKNMKDIPANIDNIMILMTDSIDIDRTVLRRTTQDSLDRLISQNYVSRASEAYCFLTDEEQEVQRGINQITVPDSATTKRVSELIYGDIYTTKKFKYETGEFSFDQYVDGQATGNTGSDMSLRFLTLSTDVVDKADMKQKVDSQGGQAIIVLADNGYYQTLEKAQQIKLYTKNKNVALMSAQTQKIIDGQFQQALKYEAEAMEKLKAAIQDAVFYVAGEKLNISTGDVKASIDQAMSYLVSHVYSEFGLIRVPAKSDSAIVSILSGEVDDGRLDGFVDNAEAVTKMEEFMDLRAGQHMQTTMSDVQERYKKKPYGWSETDIACVMARLIRDQKITVKYGGNTIVVTDSRLPNFLRLKAEIGKTNVSKRISVSAVAIKKVTEFLREYFDCMDVPKNEDDLVDFIVKGFAKEKERLGEWNKQYQDHKYPDHPILEETIGYVEQVLSQQKDNQALVSRINELASKMLDNKEDMVNLEAFFQTQVKLFDDAQKFLVDMESDRYHIEKSEEASLAMGQIRLITAVKLGQPFQYQKIPTLNGYMETVRKAHGEVLGEKRDEILEVIRQCLSAVHMAADGAVDTRDAVTKADTYYTSKKEAVNKQTCIALLDGMVFELTEYKDSACERIEVIKTPKPAVVAPTTSPKAPAAPVAKKSYKSVFRQTTFPAKKLESDADVDTYVEALRQSLKHLLKDCDGIQIK